MKQRIMKIIAASCPRMLETARKSAKLLAKSLLQRDDLHRLERCPDLGTCTEMVRRLQRWLGGVWRCPDQAVAGEVRPKRRCLLLPSSC